MENLIVELQKTQREAKEISERVWNLIKYLNNTKEYIELVKHKVRSQGNISEFEKIDILLGELEVLQAHQQNPEIEGEIQEYLKVNRILKQQNESLRKTIEEAEQQIQDSELETQALKDFAQRVNSNLTPDQLQQVIANKRVINEKTEQIETLKSKIRDLQDRTKEEISINTRANTNIMASFSELLKTISHVVPIFYGTDGPELTTEANKFIEGCMMAKDNLGEMGNVIDIIKCIKTRLFGNAYLYIHNKEFVTIEALCMAIRDKFIKTRTLTEVQELIFNSKQNAGESAYEFGERLEELLRSATELIALQWRDPSHQKSMADHCNQSAVRSFIRGLRDPKLVSKFIGHENDNLSSLLKITREAQNLLGANMRSSNVMTVQAEEPLYETVQQLIKEVRQLTLQQNTCNPSIPAQGVPATASEFCSCCNKPGQLLNDCRHRINTYCSRGRQQEHSKYYTQPSDSRINSRTFTRNPNENRSNTRFNSNDNSGRRCYGCKQRGHILSNCPANRNNGNKGRSGNYNNRRNGNGDRNHSTGNNSGNGYRPGQN